MVACGVRAGDLEELPAVRVPGERLRDIGLADVEADECRDRDAADDDHDSQRVVPTLVVRGLRLEPSGLVEPAIAEKVLLWRSFGGRPSMIRRNR